MPVFYHFMLLVKNCYLVKTQLALDTNSDLQIQRAHRSLGYPRKTPSQVSSQPWDHREQRKGAADPKNHRGNVMYAPDTDIPHLACHSKHPALLMLLMQIIR
ncbi:hypothetical protein EYF80_049928 [Liparis tanakae]|uniref:Uncharacterized protein n=1 Tax=Liparis tanakae TaxID=230148 RepID=A0A4Z2FHX5_9TELE|nr:hypothetical protein EYF80_049928 [Liparis tanakae]